METLPCLHWQSQGSLPLPPIGQSRVGYTSREAVSYRLPIRSGSLWALAPPNPSHGGMPIACCPATAAASIRRDMKLRVPPATQCVFESSNLHYASFLHGQPAAPGKQQHDGSPSLVVSHDDSCSPSRRAGSAGTDSRAQLGRWPTTRHHPRSLSCSRCAAPCSHLAQGHDRPQSEGTVGVCRPMTTRTCLP